MELTWLGTAGFRVATGKGVFYIDPYLSRNEKALPAQTLVPSDIGDAKQIFVSHGHFDHIYDVPVIASWSRSTVYCCPIAGDTLRKRGLKPEQIRGVPSDGYRLDLGGYTAQAFFSQHVKFDRWLLIRTLARIHFRLPRYLPLTRDYPAGQVLSWRFHIDDRIMHHFGSAGSSAEELERLRSETTDILLVPLQGHTHICGIALNYVRSLSPRLVIPHHQDDFFPPISMMVNIEPFIQAVKHECPNTEVLVMKMNEMITL